MNETLATQSEEIDAQGPELSEETEEQTETQDADSALVPDSEVEDEIWNQPLEKAEETIFAQDENDETETEGETETAESEDEQKSIISRPLIYKGKEIFIDNEDELIELAQKGLDYSVKMNKIKPYRKIVELISNEGLEIEDVKALADAKNGKADAIAYLKDKFGLKSEDDVYNYDDEKESDYAPVVEEEDPISEIMSEVSEKDKELAGKVAKTFEELDPSFQAELLDPNVFRAFVSSVSSGEWEEIYPRAIVIKSSNPALSWIQSYVSAAQKILNGNRQVSEPSAGDARPKSSKNVKQKPKPIEAQIEEIWDDKKSLEEIERQIFH